MQKKKKQGKKKAKTDVKGAKRCVAHILGLENPVLRHLILRDEVEGIRVARCHRRFNIQSRF